MKTDASTAPDYVRKRGMKMIDPRREQTMKDKDLIRALRHMKVETGSLVCFGCGYEHSCSIHGCAIINEAVERLQNQDTARQIMKEYLNHYCGPIPRKAFIEIIKLITGKGTENDVKE